MNKQTVILAAVLSATIMAIPAQAEEADPSTTPTVTSQQPTMSRAEAMRVRIDARKAANAALDKAVATAQKKRDMLLKRAEKIKDKAKQAEAVAAARLAYLKSTSIARDKYMATISNARAEYERVTGAAER
jgi:hypothetical protein